MARTDLSLSVEVRARAPYRSLCVEVLMQAIRDRRRGWELPEEEREQLRRWAARTRLGTQLPPLPIR